MALQQSVAVRNAELDAFGTALGASPVLKFFTGAPPANCAAANTGTQLVSMNLPSSPFAAASNGSKAKNGTWSGVGIAAGEVGHFRLYANDGVTCHKQGTVTEPTPGTGDMILDNTDVAVGQVVTVNTFTLVAGGA